MAELDLLGPAANNQAVKIAVPAARLSPEEFELQDSINELNVIGN
jgi:hypothetical protein